MRVLIIEDFGPLREALVQGLQEAGFAVDAADNGESGLWKARSNEHDVIILDLMLPKVDGLTILKTLRAAACPAHVLVLTARDAASDRILGLDAGADDYLVKPFHLDELSARLRALHRRANGLAHKLVEAGALALDTVAFEATCRGSRLELSRIEFLLLRALAERAGRVVPREALEQAMYGSGGVDSNALEVHVHALRRKLGADAIRTVRGLGYLLVRDTS